MFSATKGGSPTSGYQISRSVRLRSSASAYFNRTFGTPTNNTVWTLSAWVKRGLLGISGTVMAGSTFAMLGFRSTNEFTMWNNAGSTSAIMTGLYRDPSAWYHACVVSNGTTITGYINNKQAFSWATTITNFNSAGTHYIGRDSSGDYFDGLITEVNFVDGQALTPSSFLDTDPLTGVIRPKKYTGTFGNNGFYLNFSDNSAATAAAIGKDYSGNGNDWTPNNISVTAGVTYDSMLDVPTQWADGGNGRGNYAVLNPLATFGATLSEANLKNTAPAGDFWYNAVCTIAVPQSGKWYFEATAGALSSGLNRFMVGLVDDSFNTKSLVSIGSTAFSYGYFGIDGNKYNNGSGSAYGATYTTNDVIGVALDMDAGTLTFYKNNVSQGTAYTGLTRQYFFAVGVYNSASIFANFGQRPFAYTPPSGFKALNTQNLPTPTILKGNQYFDVSLYTGTGSALSVTNSGAMQPDFVWIKSRSAARDHSLTDAVRGASSQLASNKTDAQFTATDALTSFNSNGFSLGANVQTSPSVNENALTYVGWQWKEGATQGFDIVTYTGNGGSQTINHSLGVAPKMIIYKDRAAAASWVVMHASLANMTAQYVLLNSTAAVANLASTVSAPTSTTFGSSTSITSNGDATLAYLFAEVAGFSKFGSYTGNGSADGPFVFTGFRPAFVLIKVASGTTAAWILFDTKRDTYNVCDAELFPNSSSAETSAITNSRPIDILSNGFKIRGNAVHVNGNTYTYIYAAFAENPLKFSLAR